MAFMKWFHLVLGILFALFAIVQINDPDPWIWVALYGVTGVLSGLLFAGRAYPLLSLFLAMFSFGWLASLVPDFWNWIQMGTPSIVDEMKTEEPHIELVREFLGLLLCGTNLLWQYFYGKRRIKA